MILSFLLALITFAALLPILAPLLRGSRPLASRGSFDQAVYRDQLQELDRDIARGLITPAEADTARLEIQRRLLAADKLPSAAPRLSRSPVLAVVVFAVIAAGSVVSYLRLGAPGLPDLPFSARTAELAQPNGPNQLRQATAALAEKLKQNPADAAGWLLYGRSLAMMNDWDQAEAAYRRAIDLGQNSPEALGDHAEIMVLQAGGTVTPAAEAVFRRILAADPNSGLAKYYLAIAAMQAGEPRKAIDGLQALLGTLPSDSPLRGPIGLKIAEAAKAAGIPTPQLAAGTSSAQTEAQVEARTEAQTEPHAPGPDASAIAGAANMTDEQRQTMIRGMVASLAAKQEADPGNFDGWLRLGRAYAVLHEADKSAEAFDQAAKLHPDDASVPVLEVRALLGNHAPADRLPPRVVDLLRRIEAKDPEQPMVLWYLGLAAAQDTRIDEARRYWSRLLATLPPNNEETKMIQSAIDGLPKVNQAKD